MGQRAAIYARVATADQSCERQLRDLAGFAEWGGYEVIGTFRKTASGMKANRSARAEVMKLAQARHIDAILVTELSRWGRSRDTCALRPFGNERQHLGCEPVRLGAAADLPPKLAAACPC